MLIEDAGPALGLNDPLTVAKLTTAKGWFQESLGRKPWVQGPHCRKPWRGGAERMLPPLPHLFPGLATRAFLSRTFWGWFSRQKPNWSGCYDAEVPTVWNASLLFFRFRI